MSAGRLTFGLKLKTATVFALICLSVAVSGGFVLWAFEDLDTVVTQRRNSQLSIIALKEFEQRMTDGNLLAMDILVDRYENPGRTVVRKSDFETMRAAFELDAKKNMEALARTGHGREAEELTINQQSLLAAIASLIATIESGDKREESFAKFDEDIDGAKSSAIDKIQVVTAEIQKNFEVLQAKSEEDEQVLRIATWGSIVVSLFVSMFFGFPLINANVNALTRVRQQLSEATRDAKASSEGLAESSRSLASFSAESASAIQESVSAMTEMSAMVSQTTKNAGETSGLSRDVMSQAKDGMSVMAEMTDSMKSISSASTRLKEIVRVIENIGAKTNVINDVVFKTQLLAVNASIEAARAGHHGKGFAVVANEVASLAALSGRASTEIKELLASSATQVTDIIDSTANAIREGERTSEKSSEVFSVIARSVETISHKVEQISSASKEQESGISQTSAALNQMNQATSSTNQQAQNNALLSDEIMKIAERIRVLDGALNRVVAGRDAEASGHTDGDDLQKNVLTVSRGSKSEYLGYTSSARLGTSKGKLALARSIVEKNSGQRKSA
jgi:methyl-accepting chemotaxis protein